MNNQLIKQYYIDRFDLEILEFSDSDPDAFKFVVKSRNIQQHFDSSCKVEIVDFEKRIITFYVMKRDLDMFQ